MKLPPIGQGIGYLGLGITAVGLVWTVYVVAAGDTLLSHYYRQYTAYLDRQLRLIFLPGSGNRIAIIQLVAVAVLSASGIWLGLPYWYFLVAAALVSPGVYILRSRKEHVKRLEGQTDTLILALANALKTVPSPTAAMGSIVPVLPSPMRLEIDRLLKELRVGSTLEQGLLNMSARVESPDFDAALTALLIGLQVGGNLPAVLETTAATIREMARLQGVVRTKTSEARAQLWVLALFPFVICYGFVSLDPEYFKPLQTSFVGTLITSVAVVLWLASLMTARKILKVDI